MALRLSRPHALGHIHSSQLYRFSRKYTTSSQKPEGGSEKQQPKAPFRRCILSGIQPTGTPHLGNYLGAIRNWVRSQHQKGDPNEGDKRHGQSQTAVPIGFDSAVTTPTTLKKTLDVLYMLADQHALTVPQKPSQLRSNVRDLAVSLLACGIDPSRCILFRQSRVPHHTELAWMLMCRTPVGWVARMHQWRTKLQIANTNAVETNTTVTGHCDEPVDHIDSGSSVLNLGLLTYPVLQAADILVYRSTHVPVGEDQSQHLNLTADIAQSFNSHYGKHVFPIPRAVLASTQAKRIMSLKTPTSKMSKSDASDQSRINMDDSAESIRSKIRRATSDGIRGVTYDPVARPGVSNLLRIVMSLETGDGNGGWDGLPVDATDEMVAARVSDRFGSMSNDAFKSMVSDIVETHVAPIRNEMIRIRRDPGFIERVLVDGEDRARAVAERTMRDVRRVVGLA